MSKRSSQKYGDPAIRAIPSWYDPVTRAASNLVGGPWGVHGGPGRQRFFTPMRALFLLGAMVLVLAWLKERPCAYSPWASGTQYTHMCYSDTIPLWGIEGIQNGAVPYFSMIPGLLPGDVNYSWGRVEYPVLTGFFMYAAHWLSAPANAVINATLDNGETVNAWAGYFATTAIALSLCYFAVIYFTAKTAGRRFWDAAMVAVAPIVVVHAFTNWDLFAMAFLAAAMWSWAQQRPVLTGILLGLGTAAKLYPVLMLGALLVLAIRTGRWRGFGRTTIATVVTWLAVNLPVMIGAWAGWKVFVDLNQTRPADYATLWNVVERIISDSGQFEFQNILPTSAVNVLVLITMGLACAGIAYLALAAPQRPRVAQLVFLIVAAFLLTNKVWSAQYSIWLLPLAVLALPKWRLIVGWQLAEACVWGVSMLWFLQRDITAENRTLSAEGKPLRLLSGVDYEWVALFVLIRCAFIVAMMVLVVRDIWNPAYDDVRTIGQDDPSGGEFDEAPDAFTLSRSAGAEPATRQAPPTTPSAPARDDDDVLPIHHQ